MSEDDDPRFKAWEDYMKSNYPKMWEAMQIEKQYSSPCPVCKKEVKDGHPQIIGEDRPYHYECWGKKNADN